MSLQLRTDRREGPRYPVRPNSNNRQAWVPRGGGGVIGGLSTPILETPPQQPTPNLDPNGYAYLNSFMRNGGGNSNYHPPHMEIGPRGGNFVHQRNIGPRPLNPRKQNDRGKNQVHKNLDSNLLPQLVQEIQVKLAKGTVECMICYDMVRRSAPIWSCSSCYSIFHLNCIKKWARAPTSADLMAEKNQGLNWRCPGCQSVQLLAPKDIRYVCFCGKRPDPPSDLYLTPHSCGEPCGRSVERQMQPELDGGDRCPHLCVLQCHPGPCPPCKAFAPPRSCPCGKKMITTRCSVRKSVLTCGLQCEKFLDCGRHQCRKVCHTGPCEPCVVPTNASCFCKKKMEVVLCGEMSVKGKLIENDGVFSCNSVCSKTLVCGNHTCGDTCHPGQCGDCELMPCKIKNCPCGKTKIKSKRVCCTDPIPTCSNICGMLLPCKIHRCKEICHVGKCPSCLLMVDQKCRCGSSSRKSVCHMTTRENGKFCCEKPCGRKKSCGRHRCSERCCPISNSDYMLSGEWDPHLCSMICGKKLRCGQHFCESLCHSGHCSPCLETIFTDLTCACGKTSLPPPLPCGTPPPSCQYPCSVPQPCGHSSAHGCHFGDCPPCSVPVAKECTGGHVVLRNIPCGSKEIRCNQLCGKTRQCGMHACGRTCHPPPCDSSCVSVSGAKSSCSQVCGAPRRDCRHTCTASCHPGSPCPDLRCDFPVTITCSCGRITTKVPCGAGGSNGGFACDTVFEASIIQKLPVPLQPIEANGKKTPLGQRKLVCDGDCAKVERKRVLADAFDITPTNLDALHFGENSVPDSLKDLCRREPKWVWALEDRFKFLVLGKSRGSNSNGLKVHVFIPMSKEKRDAVRQIAERWKLSVHAAGWEPKRFIVVHVTPKSKAPLRIIGFKGSALSSTPPAFDPSIDMDQRLVVALLDLPREAEVSALVLRFGGECELVWLNDKNALAVFSDPARAATAMRRLDHGSAYQGASVVKNSVPGPNAWVGGTGIAKDGGSGGGVLRTNNPWKKAVVQESCWADDSWGVQDLGRGARDVPDSAWKMKEAPISASTNRYTVLVHDSTPFSNLTLKSSSGGFGNQSNHQVGSSSSSTEPRSFNQESKPGDGIAEENVVSEVVDDWEEACDSEGQVR